MRGSWFRGSAQQSILLMSIGYTSVCICHSVPRRQIADLVGRRMPLWLNLPQWSHSNHYCIGIAEYALWDGDYSKHFFFKFTFCRFPMANSKFPIWKRLLHFFNLDVIEAKKKKGERPYEMGNKDNVNNTIQYHQHTQKGKNNNIIIISFNSKEIIINNINSKMKCQ